jgi:NADPH-dependent 2,4-dienoyl-CoA reductase/sulfur reductase-like enzyme
MRLPSRRQFLEFVGRAGGATAVYNVMAAMGLIPVPTTYAGPPELEPGSGSGVRVVVLGAGLAGMTAAYELSKAGYVCAVLEARHVLGGQVRQNSQTQKMTRIVLIRHLFPYVRIRVLRKMQTAQLLSSEAGI